MITLEHRSNRGTPGVLALQATSATRTVFRQTKQGWLLSTGTCALNNGSATPQPTGRRLSDRVLRKASFSTRNTAPPTWLSRHSMPTVVFSSPRRYYSTPHRVHEIDLTIPLEQLLPPALFARIKGAVEPLLGRLQIEELEEDQQHQDLTFLAGETGFEKRLLARFILAYLLTRIGIEPEFWFALLGGSSFSYAETKASRQTRPWSWNPCLPSMPGRRARPLSAVSTNARSARPSRADRCVVEVLFQTSGGSRPGRC